MEHNNQMHVEQQFLPCALTNHDSEMVQRQSVTYYKPNVWKYDFLQSLSSKFIGERYVREAEKLKVEVKQMFDNAEEMLAKLELVDRVRKLGLECHFNKEIKEALDTAAASISGDNNNNILINVVEADNLFVTALIFRLLRQNGYHVSQDVFNIYLDEMGRFKTGSTDVEGVMELYEASHLATEGENILEEAKAFSTRILKNGQFNLESDLAKQVSHALDLPLHRRVQWFDVKWYIDAYEMDSGLNRSSLLHFAKINFNLVQATLQNDLREISRWWRNLGLIKKMKFTRDRVVESFMCTVGLVFEPQYSSFRKWMTKVVVMILVIDDIYDIYGSLQELHHFTNAIKRWDTNEIQELPECMKICFQVLNDIVNEIALGVQTEKGWGHVNVIPHLKHVWADFCESLFMEAKWFNEGHTPSLHEYLSNAWISSSGTVLSVHSFFYIITDATQDITNFLEKNQDFIYDISLIIRLCNDLGTSVAEQERGDAASSIVCEMREANISEEAARNHIKEMINKKWKKINGQCFNTQTMPMMQLLVNVLTNMARVSHNLYQNGDKFGVQDRENKMQILSLLVQPLKLS